MFTYIKNWWNRSATQQQEITRLAQKLEALETAKQIEITQLTEQVKAAEIEKATKYPTTEPWVEIKGSKVDPVKGIQIELDWNSEFIKYLQQAGIDGPSEDVIIQKWLAFLYNDMATDLEQTAISHTQQGTVGDVL